MSNTRIAATLSAVAFCTLTILAPAHAQFTVTWDNGGNFVFAPSSRPPVTPATGRQSDGDVRFLSGTIQYTGTQTVYSFGAGTNAVKSASGGDLTFQNNQYIAGPYATDVLNLWASSSNGIAPGATFNGTLTAIYIDASTPSGFYDRDGFGVVGNGGSLFFGLYSNAARTNLIGNSANTAGVTIRIGTVAAPEASTALLVALPGLLLLVRRR